MRQRLGRDVALVERDVEIGRAGGGLEGDVRRARRPRPSRSRRSSASTPASTPSTPKGRSTAASRSRSTRSTTVKEGELLTVKIALSSPPSEYLTPGQLRCMLQAKSPDEVVKCLPQNRKNLVVKAGIDVAGYARHHRRLRRHAVRERLDQLADGGLERRRLVHRRHRERGVARHRLRGLARVPRAALRGRPQRRATSRASTACSSRARVSDEPDYSRDGRRHRGHRPT